MHLAKMLENKLYTTLYQKYYLENQTFLFILLLVFLLDLILLNVKLSKLLCWH